MATASEITVSPFMQVIRITLILINVIFWITGFCLFVIGIWATVELNKYEELPHPNNYDSVAIVLIVIGLVIACIGICGCCGALKKNACLLKTFALFLGIIIICEFSVAITGYAYRSKIKTALSHGLKSSMTKYFSGGIIKTVWNNMQENFECCGNTNYTNWFLVKHQNKTAIPESCCKLQKSNCSANISHNATEAGEKIYTEGCFHFITKFFQDKFSVLASGALAIAIIQLISVACSGCFWNHVQKKTKYELV